MAKTESSGVNAPVIHLENRLDHVSDVFTLQLARVLRGLRKAGPTREVGEHFAGIDQENAHVVFAKLRSPALRHSAQCELARVVGGALRRAAQRCSGGNIDQVAALALLEEPGCLARHEHHSGDVSGEDGVEAGAIHVDQFLKHADAGIVDQDVQVAEFLLHLTKGPQDVGLVGDVRLYPDHAQRTCGFGQPFGVAPGDGDARARLFQYLGRGPADPA